MTIVTKWDTTLDFLRYHVKRNTSDDAVITKREPLLAIVMKLDLFLGTTRTTSAFGAYTPHQQDAQVRH